MNKNRKKVNKNIIYNTIGSFVYLFCQWLITFVVVWISGYETAGILSISMSISTTFCVIATFNMRNYQSSDISGKYSEKTYLKSRIYTCLAAYIVTVLYSLFKHFSMFQFLCINAYMAYKLSEAVVDVLHGSIQKKWRFDIIAKSYFIRGIISIASFGLLLKMTNNLLITLCVMGLLIYLFILIYDVRKYNSLFKIKGETNNREIIKLLAQCVPLVIYGMLFSYVAMYPRIITENIYGAKMLGYYASVATPALIVQVAASFIFTPLISLFAEMFKSDKVSLIKRTAIKVIIFTVVFCIIFLIGSYFMADYVLELLFTKSILPYTYLFYGVIIISTLTAIIWLLGTILTVIRNYYSILLGSIVSFILVLLISKPILIRYGLNGINIIGITVLSVHTLIYFISIIRLKSNNKKSIYYIRSTSIINDSRASKEISALIKNNHKVVVFGWDRDKKISDYKNVLINNVNINCKFFKYSAGYGESLKNTFGIILFQIWLFIKLFKNRYKIKCIHACDFDCGFISSIICKMFNIKLVYDMYDYYSDSRQMPSSVEKLVNALENSVINYADVSIICGEWRKKQIKKATPKKLCVVHNSPDIDFIDKKSIIKSKSNKTKIVYVGILQDHRLLVEILKEIEKNPEYELHIGGFGKHEKEFVDASKKYKNIYFYGSLKYNEVLCLERDCDILFATYDPVIKNHKYSAPNKIYEAMALGKPIIVCKGTGIDELIVKNKIGVSIGYDAKDFVDALKHFDDKKYIKDVSKRTKELYDTTYNWKYMEEKLINIYDEILGGKDDNSNNSNL